MRRISRVFGIALLGVGWLAAPAAAGGLDVRLGAFLPRAQSNLFRDDSVLYTVDRDDWRGFQGGAEYSFSLGERFELGLHLDAYGRTVHTNYRDFVRPSGREITQSLQLNAVPLGFTFRFVPRGPHTLTPYFGVGADVVFYEYEEFGDFVDFEDEEFPIIEDAFISSGAAAGLHVAAGLRVPVSHDFSLTGEVRYQWAQTDMGDDFRGNTIDLSGATATVGLNVRF